MNTASKRNGDIFRARMLTSEPQAPLERTVSPEGNAYGAYRPVERRNGLPERRDYHYHGSGQSDHQLDARWLTDLPPDAPERGW